MPNDADAPPTARHRVIFCHFDGYSTALLFARWPSGSLLWPAPLAEGARAFAATDAALPAAEEGAAVREAAIAQLGLNPAEVVRVAEFDEGLTEADGSTVRVHLLRFDTFEALGAAIEPAGGVFRHLPALRGSSPVELGLLRVVFNLMIGGGGRA